jgi:hypothetical protein
MPAIAQIVCASPVVNSAFVTIDSSSHGRRLSFGCRASALAVAGAARGPSDPPGRPSGLQVKR